MSKQQRLRAEVDIQLRKEFQEYTGIAAHDYSWKVFTREQQLERYAKQLAFWLIGIASDNLKPQLTAREAVRLEMVEFGHAHTLLGIKEKFPPEDVKIIMARALQRINQKILQQM